MPNASRSAPDRNSSDAIAAAGRQVAETIGATAIAAFTTSGASALRVARERPACPVLAIAPDGKVARRLAVVWGAHAVVAPEASGMSEAVTRALRIAHVHGLAQHGDEVVVVAGLPFGVPGNTNSLRVARLK